jgi:hypothetical protein
MDHFKKAFKKYKNVLTPKYSTPKTKIYPKLSKIPLNFALDEFFSF